MTNLGFSEVEGLTQAHLKHLLASAISIDVIRERGCRSIDVAKRLAEFGFSKQQRRVPGFLIPQYAPDGSVSGYQYKPDSPRLNAKDQPRKYEVPAGAGLRLDMPPRCRGAAGDPSIPIWITEGSKKADALATAGACAVSLSGVWGFKGKNAFGASVFLSDFDLIAWKGRDVYPAFDSDVLTKPQVHQALMRLSAHLSRLGGRLHHVQLPPGENGAKTGVDDYLAGGHSLEDLKALASDTPPEPDTATFELEHELYTIAHGRICMRQREGLVPLANFLARIAEEIIIDNGVEETMKLEIEGQMDGQDLPRIEISINDFEGMSWPIKKWGARATIRAGSGSKEHLRCAIQRISNLNGRTPRRIFQHTGWREIDGERVFLGGAGAIGRPDVQVQLPPLLRYYELPIEPGNIDVLEAIRASISFLDVSSHEVTYALWAAQYLAPLAEELEPAFTLWLLGHTGGFKSALSALALCHFGFFPWEGTKLPASWEGTANSLERLASQLKDHPLVIDDYAPGTTTSATRDIETKIERIVRSQGNRTARSRLRSDTTLQAGYIPRGVIICSGEQLPSTESGGARLFVVQVEEAATDTNVLTWAQGERHLYRYAMADYCAWLQRGWDRIMPALHDQVQDLQHEAMKHGIHRRLPAVVGCMTVAFRTAMAWAVERGAIEPAAAEAKSDEAWKMFLRLADQQGARVNEQRPATLFLEALRTLLLQGQVYVKDKTETDMEPRAAKQGPGFIGWFDSERYYLLPVATYGAVYKACSDGGQLLPFKPQAVWADLVREGVLEAYKRKDEVIEYAKTFYIGRGEHERKSKRGLYLKRRMVDGDGAEQGTLQVVM